MTYEATVQFKFDSTFEPSYGTSSWTSDDFIPEEHYLITAPAADLNCKQYFRLFEKFLLCVGMDPVSIRSAAMSLVFNDSLSQEEQRKICLEYELTLNEDLQEKFEEYKSLYDDSFNESDTPNSFNSKHKLTCEKDDKSPECQKAWNDFWEENYYPEEYQKYSEEVNDDSMPPWGHSDMEALKYTDEELNAMCYKAECDEQKRKYQEYNLREAEYYNKRAELDLSVEIGPHKKYVGFQSVSSDDWNDFWENK